MMVNEMYAQVLVRHQAALRDCRACADMQGPVVVGRPVRSSIMLVGQAPGDREGVMGRPFAWTAGRTLFGWFSQLGVDEETFRSRVYMAAVCRCFPGKNPGGGDRVPNPGEVTRCRQWLDREFELLSPRLILPVGKLAIGQLVPVNKLVDVIGRCHRLRQPVGAVDVLPLPHPSGASTWHRTQPGKDMLQQALALIERHPAWRETFT